MAKTKIEDLLGQFKSVEFFWLNDAIVDFFWPKNKIEDFFSQLKSMEGFQLNRETVDFLFAIIPWTKELRAVSRELFYVPILWMYAEAESGKS